jgi:splicing factor 3A subunit 3
MLDSGLLVHLQVEEETSSQFDAGNCPGWEDRGLGTTPAATSSASASGVDLDAFDSVEELESIGAERLKEALTALGLKCGGTPRERAQRLWLTKTIPLHALDK